MNEPKPSVTIVGAGAVGAALAVALQRAGYTIARVISRSTTTAWALADTVGANPSARLTDAVDSADVIMCCVPDDSIRSVAGTLSSAGGTWTGRIIGHSSGALSSSVFAPLESLGAATMSFHPVQTFSRSAPTESFSGIYIGIEGSPSALAVAKVMARDLGATPVQIPRNSKTAYHLAATIASNFVVTLAGMSKEVMAAAGMDPDEGFRMLVPLIMKTCENLQTLDPEHALTGPASRADRETITHHIATLIEKSPHLLPAYTALTTEAVRLAVRARRITDADASGILDLLVAALDQCTDE